MARESFGSEEQWSCCFMYSKKRQLLRWREMEDILFYRKENIIKQIEDPKCVSKKRDLFSISELQEKWRFKGSK